MDMFCKKYGDEFLPGQRGVIAIDGRCAAGKTTLALKLAAQLGAGVVHMDDFFLPPELRNEERRREPGGNVHYERFLEEVIPYLSKGEDFSYRRFDCSKMGYGNPVRVPGTGCIIVEGAYSCHPALGNYMTHKVFMDVSAEVQLERIRQRNGAEKLADFQEKWIPMEEAYFEKFRIQQLADIVIKSENF